MTDPFIRSALDALPEVADSARRLDRLDAALAAYLDVPTFLRKLRRQDPAWQTMYGGKLDALREHYAIRRKAARLLAPWADA